MTLLQEYEEGVKESEKLLKDAEQEIKSAKEWHYKMLIEYAKSIQALDNYKKTL